MVALSLVLGLWAVLGQTGAATGAALSRVTTAPDTNQVSDPDQRAPQVAIAYPFQTLPTGSPLPSDAQCTAIMDQHRNPDFEPRPENNEANHTNVYAAGYRFPAQELAGFGARVTGDFAGTTDEILQWGACKWGFDVDTVRAQAMQESHWRQSLLGDCSPRQRTQPDTNHCASVGILQVKGADLPPDHPFTYPYARISTVFNVDYTLAVRRQCYEGRIPWLNDADVRSQNTRLYGAGDDWGCMGFWYSGRWYDRGAETYLYRESSLGLGVQNHYDQRTWLSLRPEQSSRPPPLLAAALALARPGE